MVRQRTETELKRLTKITKVLFIILGLMMLILAIVYPIFLVFAALVFFFVYKYKAKNPTKVTPSEKEKVNIAEAVIIKDDKPQANVNNTSVAVARISVAHATKMEIDTEVLGTLNKKCIAFDVETTGLSPATDRIVEIGAVLFVDGIPTDHFSTLVNPKIRISESASAVNHITNSMLATAPSEKEVYSQLIEFFGEALNGEIITCAHNAKFDFDFLCNTLSRLGYDAHIRYIDTLGLSRKYIKGLSNYKQNTVAEYFGLVNNDAHRAAADAEICGGILKGLLSCVQDDLEEQKKQREKISPSKEELEICAYIQDIIVKNGGDTDWLRYRKNSSNYVDVTCLYTFLKFKFAKKGKYIIVRNEAVIGLNMITEPCTSSEGGTTTRIYFDSPFELEPLSTYFFNTYKDCRNSMLDYIGMGNYARRAAEQSIKMLKALSRAEAESLITDAENRKDEESSDNGEKPRTTIKKELIIRREDVEVKPVHSRVTLNSICNLGNWDKGFDAGHPHWDRGEVVRKEGNLEEAVRLFDLARYNGYAAPVLYGSYAKVYRQLKDYENEIDILEEGIKRRVTKDDGVFEARKNKALQLLFSQQEAQRKILEKEQKAKDKETVAATEAKLPRGRAILQLTDDQIIIREYESIAAAVEETEINSKSIREAANGIQKHAGGFCWKYKE